MKLQARIVLENSTILPNPYQKRSSQDLEPTELYDFVDCFWDVFILGRNGLQVVSRGCGMRGTCTQDRSLYLNFKMFYFLLLWSTGGNTYETDRISHKIGQVDEDEIRFSGTSIRRKGRRALIKCAEDPMKLMYPGNKYHIVDDNRSSKPEKKNLAIGYGMPGFHIYKDPTDFFSFFIRTYIYRKTKPLTFYKSNRYP